jgi:hypothetical protein
MFLLGLEACCAVSMNDHDDQPPKSKLPLQQKHSGQMHTEKINQQTNETIRQICAWQQLVNPHNLELVRGNYIRKAKQHYSEQQPIITTTCTPDDGRLG